MGRLVCSPEGKRDVKSLYLKRLAELDRKASAPSPRWTASLTTGPLAAAGL